MNEHRAINGCRRIVRRALRIVSPRWLRRTAPLYASRLFLRWSVGLRRVGGPKAYQNLEIGGRNYKGKRNCEDRWDAIRQVLESYHAHSVLDVGCAEAWFLRRAATELGCLCLGVDSSDDRVILGETARLYDRAERWAVMNAELDVEDLLRLPRFDVVFSLSVAHHVMRHHGVEAARSFVSALASRARKAMVFEMGTSDEKKMQWADTLPDMPQGQTEFVEEFLASCGLRNIRRIGVTPSLRKETERMLYVAEPAPQAGGVERAVAGDGSTQTLAETA